MINEFLRRRGCPIQVPCRPRLLWSRLVHA
uniref:Uncharacterized protein n=1 Tax=Anguilla anguilla TaxID=7936 RepID=A0A0E9TSH2_ANGAN